MAMDQWVHDPAAESALSQLLPCLDPKTVGETLDITKTMTATAVDMTNAYTVNVSNHEFPPNVPFYHNQSGPLVPLLCNPLDQNHNPRPCAPDEILLANASQVLGHKHNKTFYLTTEAYNMLLALSQFVFFGK